VRALRGLHGRPRRGRPAAYDPPTPRPQGRKARPVAARTCARSRAGLYLPHL
jgi:hypothetical protein